MKLVALVCKWVFAFLKEHWKSIVGFLFGEGAALFNRFGHQFLPLHKDLTPTGTLIVFSVILCIAAVLLGAALVASRASWPQLLRMRLVAGLMVFSVIALFATYRLFIFCSQVWKSPEHNEVLFRQLYIPFSYACVFASVSLFLFSALTLIAELAHIDERGRPIARTDESATTITSTPATIPQPDDTAVRGEN